MTPQNISTIVFDLGNVLYNIDIALSEQAFLSLGLPGFSTLYSLTSQSGLFDALECGHISPTQFMASIRNIAEVAVSDEQIISAWNALLIDFIPDCFPMLHQLKSRYQIALLSNTNAIHMLRINSQVREQSAFQTLSEAFHHAFLSYEAGLRKPFTEIYDLVTTTLGCEPAQILFIDDNLANIESATAFGWHTIHKTPEISLQSILSDYM